MNERGKFRRPVAAACLALSLAACGAPGATTSDTVGGFLVAPDKYVLYNCPQLFIAETAAINRLKQLDALIEKAGTGAGGKVASTLAYEPEYAQTRGELNEVRRAIREKDCKPPPPKPAPAVPAAPAAAAKKPR